MKWEDHSGMYSNNFLTTNILLTYDIGNGILFINFEEIMNSHFVSELISLTSECYLTNLIIKDSFFTNNKAAVVGKLPELLRAMILNLKE